MGIICSSSTETSSMKQFKNNLKKARSFSKLDTGKVESIKYYNLALKNQEPNENNLECIAEIQSECGRINMSLGNFHTAAFNFAEAGRKLKDNHDEKQRANMIEYFHLSSICYLATNQPEKSARILCEIIDWNRHDSKSIEYHISILDFACKIFEETRCSDYHVTFHQAINYCQQMERCEKLSEFIERRNKLSLVILESRYVPRL